MLPNPIARLEESLANNKRMLEVIKEEPQRHPIEFKQYVEDNIEQYSIAINILKGFNGGA
jgi:hypothetical protein